MPITVSLRRFLPPVYFLVIVLLYLMPLPLHWTTHIPGDSNRGDAVFHAWPFWYFPYAIIHGITPLMHPNLQFYPDGIAMALTNSNLIGCFLMAPITLTLGVCAAVNTWLLLQLWMGGWMMFLFVRRLGCSNAPAYFAGTAYACSPFVTTHLVGHYTLVCIGFPAAILYVGLRLYQSIESPLKTRLCLAITLGLLWSALAVTDFYLTMMTIFLFVGLLFHLAWINGIRSLLKKSFLMSLGVGAILSIGCVLPMVFLVLKEREGKDYSRELVWPAYNVVTDPASLVTPSKHHWIAVQITEGGFQYPFQLQENESSYLGLALFFVVLLSLIYGRNFRVVAIWLFLILFFIGLGGRNHETTTSFWENTPIGFGKYWPTTFPFKEFRVPSRWIFAIQTVAIIIGSLGLQQLCRKFPAKKSAILSAVFLFTFIDLFRPPILASDIPEKSEIRIGSGTVLDLPVSLSSGNEFNAGPYNLTSLRRQMAHGRPILTLYTARLSREEFEKRMADPEFKALIDLQGQNKSGVAPTIPDLDWHGFARRYDITTIRIPTEFRYTEVFKDLGNRMLPGIEWQEYPGEIIGNAAPGSPDQ